MSENSTDFPENFPEIRKKDELFSSGEGISYSKIPNNFFKLKKLIGARSNDVLVALAMAQHSANSRTYPVFSIGLPELAEATALSERAVSRSVRFLTLNRVVFVTYRMGHPNRYTWNVEFLKGIDCQSVPPLTDSQGYHCPTVSTTTDCQSDLYIEFSLELFLNSFKEFFAPNQPPYQFYVPKKRGQKGLAARCGSTVEVDRAQAWREAAHHAYRMVKNREDALARVYLALRASNDLEAVTFPKKVMEYRVLHEPSIHEARSRSHLRQHLYSDDDFKQYIDQKLEQRRGKHG